MVEDAISQKPSVGERGEATRERLLLAAIEVFGRKGFEASTRELAAAAAVNLAAIPYHFGSKRGLYLAAAEHIADQMRGRIAPVMERVRAETHAPVGPVRARVLIRQILEGLARVMVDEKAASWARFVIREQMEPSQAFDRLHAGAIGPTFKILVLLIAEVTGGEPEDAHVRIQVPRLIGQILIFRAAHATILRELRWQRIGTNEFAMIRAVIATTVDGLGPITAPRGSASLEDER